MCYCSDLKCMRVECYCFLRKRQLPCAPLFNAVHEMPDSNPTMKVMLDCLYLVHSDKVSEIFDSCLYCAAALFDESLVQNGCQW